MNERNMPYDEKKVLPEIPRSNRVVVYGTKGGSAPYLSQAIIDQAASLGVEVESYYCRDAAIYREAFFNRKYDNSGAQISVDTAPSGVIVCPEMRQYDPWNGNGMTFNSFDDGGSGGQSFFDVIASLCDIYGVPVLKNEQTAEDFSER